MATETLEELLDGGRVTQEGDGHLQSPRRNITLSSEDVIRDPLDEVGRVLVLYVLHLFFDFLHGDLTTEHGSNGKISSVSGI